MYNAAQPAPASLSLALSVASSALRLANEAHGHAASSPSRGNLIHEVSLYIFPAPLATNKTQEGACVHQTSVVHMFGSNQLTPQRSWLLFSTVVAQQGKETWISEWQYSWMCMVCVGGGALWVLKLASAVKGCRCYQPRVWGKLDLKWTGNGNRRRVFLPAERRMERSQVEWVHFTFRIVWGGRCLCWCSARVDSFCEWVSNLFWMGKRFQRRTKSLVSLKVKFGPAELPSALLLSTCQYTSIAFMTKGWNGWFFSLSIMVFD